MGNMDFTKLSIAPMLDLTDRHFRYFARLLNKQILLYTEMVSTGAILHNAPEKYLQYNKEEHPIALQLGGSSPADLAKCAKIAEDFGYDEVNLNCGCPSPRVQSGFFGACLMREPDLVAECVSAMQSVVKIPVSVKTRIGIDSDDSWEFFLNFVESVANAGCKYWIIHARKAVLKGLSPKENRSIPPLDYGRVYKLKELHPEYKVVLNGGIKTTDFDYHLLDGIMIGRAAYHTPWILSDGTKTREEVLEEYIPYAKEEYRKGASAITVTKHLKGLFHGLAGAKEFRANLANAILS